MTVNLVAIDPLALLLPSHVYQQLIEKFHPHTLDLAHLRAVTNAMSPSERAQTLESARAFVAHGQAVEEALAGRQAG